LKNIAVVDGWVNLDLSDTDINHSIKYPLNRGWLYEVNDWLFSTQLQATESDESTERLSFDCRRALRTSSTAGLDSQ